MRAIRVGDWVIGIPGKQCPNEHLTTPMYVLRIDDSDGLDRILLHLTEDESHTNSSGWYSYRYRLYNRTLLSKTFNGKVI